ncbi:pseudouridine synthase [Moraxella catarrhalis]|uniref:pseudouridine synthase n=1 Tax=Moraxella catarrhalis TaxID=480 RepID=UPI0007E418C5|nr:pseudouridine synthase [Moraxella catarrhalis]OAV13763.1 hypothetical protein AO380_0116 [Moraxella catarrhalis]OAV29643.1 hypothetical protein AO367_1818 [Moraxella catarrhalis]
MMRQGVSPSKLYLPKIKDAPLTIFEYVCKKFHHIGTAVWQKRFNDGLVKDIDGRILDLNSLYQHGMTITYYRHLCDEVVVPFEHHIIYEDQTLLVVDKPHFLTVSPAGGYVQQTLLTRLKQATGNPHLSPVHRLDKQTAGLMIFTKTCESRRTYQSLFNDRKINKIYHAIAPMTQAHQFPLQLSLPLVRGEPFYTMAVGIGEPNTHTDIDILAVSEDGKWAKYELKPTTGKLHQLRVHLNYLGIPIAHDNFYPKVMHRAKDDFDKPLQLLAKHLSFTDPLTNKPMAFESGFELDFSKV